VKLVMEGSDINGHGMNLLNQFQKSISCSVAKVHNSENLHDPHQTFTHILTG
jgi:hypothetical protein